jgi:hypothetical protein
MPRRCDVDSSSASAPTTVMPGIGLLPLKGHSRRGILFYIAAISELSGIARVNIEAKKRSFYMFSTPQRIDTAKTRS